MFKGLNGSIFRIIIQHFSSILKILFFYLFSNRFHFNPNVSDGGLFLCCGQLVGKKGGPRHVGCAGTNSGYRIGGLFLEMEYCPFPQCCKTFTDPQSNIHHQEGTHRSVRMWWCPICEINFVSEGCSTRHILSFHQGPTGYAVDQEEVCKDVKLCSFSA